jgi:hypothetical protein
VEQWLGIGNFRPTWALENTVLDYRPIRILGQLRQYTKGKDLSLPDMVIEEKLHLFTGCGNYCANYRYLTSNTS